VVPDPATVARYARWRGAADAAAAAVVDLGGDR